MKFRKSSSPTSGLRSVGVVAIMIWLVAIADVTPSLAQDKHEPVSADEMELIREVENQRIKVIEKVVGSVIAIYGPGRQGGGSGVIIDPSGIALTNHHVIEGAGMHGFGGLDDGILYEWDLVGTDPGGDVAIIKMKGKDRFPFTPLGDSEKVKIGDWALAMGNPFLLAHDQVPTVTLGVVSGVERFQEGTGGKLVYGNCIQVDSSINPGNSGGPLFNMDGEVIGINGRGSFRDRGRVNVGLGYAISSNQIKNFLPDLMATRIVEHGTLDAAFSNRGGKVICSTIDLDSPAAKAGLELGDQLLKFEGHEIKYSNQFKNLICTYPEDWPANLLIEKKDGSQLTINVRMFGLPYNFQPDEKEPPKPNDKDDEEDKDHDGDPQKDQPEDGRPEQPKPADNAELKKFLLNETGVTLNDELNACSVDLILGKWRRFSFQSGPASFALKVTDEIFKNDEIIGHQTLHVASDGRFRVEHQLTTKPLEVFLFDGDKFWDVSDAKPRLLDLVEAKTKPELTQAMALLASLPNEPFSPFGSAVLDGGDKSQGMVASRIMWLDEDDDWFYGWLSLYNENGAEQVRLLKVSGDKDCSGSSHGITFGDYRESEGVMLPWRKDRVSGLDEQIQWTARTVSVVTIPGFESSLFQARREESPQ